MISLSLLMTTLLSSITACYTTTTDSLSEKNTPSCEFTTNNWVYTDCYDRSVANYEQCGPKRDKLVGIFYFLWHSDRNKAINTTDFFKGHPNGINQLQPGYSYYWGEPEDGYYCTNDPWIIRKHLNMFAVAGIDFLYFDITNGSYEWVYSAVDAIAKVAMQMQAEGIKVPKFVFTTNYYQKETITAVYDRIYRPGKYKDLWLYWEGKPVILAPRTAAPNEEIADFFTWRYGWSSWGESLQDSWPWHNIGGYGYTNDPNDIEQMTVSKGSHPTINVGSSYRLGPEGIIRFGADFKDQFGGEQPPINTLYRCEETGTGALFEKQWDKVFERDPDVLMITQWNEWIAVCCSQRYCIEVWKNRDMTNEYFLGEKLEYEDRYFVDMFNDEYNRDIEPMKGGYGDVFYYRMVHYIRKFKGMDAPDPASESRTITIDGLFNEWKEILPVYTDLKGDVMHRDYPSVDNTTRYVNRTGRNDIVESRVCHDNKNLYLYVRTAAPLTSHTDSNWMLLFLNVDCNKKTGWEGYDFLINAKVKNNRTSSIHRWDGTQWTPVAKIRYRYSGNEMELSVPLDVLNLDPNTVALDFHRADNLQNLTDITEFCISGDSAPDRKFDFHYENRTNSKNK